MTADTNPLVLYDGHCALCNTWVKILLALDREGALRFAALQSEYARELLRRSGIDPEGLETVVLLEAGPVGIHTKSDAVFAAIARLRSPLKYLRYGRYLPRALRDRIYDFIADHRYAWFGRYESCPRPKPEHRHRFLDAD